MYRYIYNYIYTCLISRPRLIRSVGMCFFGPLRVNIHPAPSSFDGLTAKLRSPLASADSPIGR